MNMKHFIAFLISICIFSTASAQDGAKLAQPGKAYATLISASMQRTISASNASEPTAKYIFLLKWKSSEAPEAIFWKGDNAWMSCEIKVYKTSKCRKSDEVSLERIRRNYYVVLTAMPGGKFRMPEEIQNTKGQNIFFQTDKSPWLYVPVTKVTKKKDIRTK